MKRVPISPHVLRDLYLNRGLTTYQIAEQLGFCQATVWKRLHEYEIQPRLSYIPVDIFKNQLKIWYVDQKLSTWEIEKRFGYSRSTVHRKLKEFDLHARSSALSHIRSFRADFSGDILEKSYLIGFRIGDLNVTKRGLRSETITVKCASTKQGQVELFRDLFSRYGHILQGAPTAEGKVNIQASLNQTFSFLVGKDSSKYEWAFKQKDTFFAFLGGFSDAEGSFFISSNQGQFSIGNYNNELLSKIQDTLGAFGIHATDSVDRRKGRVVSGYVSRGDYYSIHCGRKIYVLKLLDELSPYLRHPDKIRDAQRIRKNILDRNAIFGNLNMKK